MGYKIRRFLVNLDMGDYKSLDFWNRVQYGLLCLLLVIYVSLVSLGFHFVCLSFYKVNTIFYIFENIGDLYLGRMYSEFASKLRIGIMFNMSFCIFFYIVCFVFGFDFSDLFLFSFNILVLLFFIIVGLVWFPLYEGTLFFPGPWGPPVDL